MKATCSFSSGMCIVEKEPSSARLVDALTGAEVPACDWAFAACNTDDWTSVEASDIRGLCEIVQAEHGLLRGVLDILDSLSGLSRDLTLALLERVESLLQAGASVDLLESRLLIAPLRDCEQAQRLSRLALANGFAGTAQVLEELHSQQPALSRLVGHWLELPSETFADIPGGQHRLWRVASERGVLKKAVEANDFGTLEQVWTSLIWSERLEPKGRASLSVAAKTLASRMYPEGAIQIKERRAALEPEEPERDLSWSGRITGGEAYDRAMNLIASVAQAASAGRDRVARKGLRDLLRAQTSHAEDVPYAIMSLCNLAKQCADFFRTDLERECLQAALELCSTDAWTLIQCGDHYKRVGEYQLALEYFHKAIQQGYETVGASAIADVYAQQGDFGRALDTYRSLPNCDEPLIQTAIADNLRRCGQLGEARLIYEKLIAAYPHQDRALSGKAELHRRVGEYGAAKQIYKSILETPRLEKRSRLFYQYCLAGVYKQMGCLDDALQLADKVLHVAPFFMPGRVLKASLLGLLDQSEEALSLLPQSDTSRLAFNEWIRSYVRGLLLLRLTRYADARKELISNLQSKLIIGESNSILRLAAAVASLKTKSGVEEASRLISGISIQDCYAQYLILVLHYHIAVSSRNEHAIAKLEQQLAGAETPNHVRQAFEAIRRREWGIAWQHELNALLCLSAAA